MKFRDCLNLLIRPTGSALVKHESWRKAEKQFHSWHYLRITARRLEHLASLNIPVHGGSVLEVGAGVGDFSGYYLDRGCEMTITEPREEGLAYLRKRFPNADTRFLNMDDPSGLGEKVYDYVHCYGLLYHLKDPERALEFLSRHCGRMLFLETCVSFGAEDAVNLVNERQSALPESYVGVGCRPTRHWVFSRLKKYFEHVYVTRAQPNHEQFPTDWTRPDKHGEPFSRSVFVASREPLNNPALSPELLDRQQRH